MLHVFAQVNECKQDGLPVQDSPPSSEVINHVTDDDIQAT